jgi:hypothetical protein
MVGIGSPAMPDNRLRVQGEKLARALDEHIDREFSERSEALQVRLAVADYFHTRTSTAKEPRRPFPFQSPDDERPIGDPPGDWN